MIRGEFAERAEEELIAGGVPFVEATVVRAQSPTSVRAGDAALVRPDGTIEGFVGGVCAETSVRLHALRVLETGEPLLLRILPGEAEGEAAVGDGAVTVKNPCLSGGAMEIFLEPHLPAATLRVVGRSPIALALADLGKRLGYAVELSAAGDSDPSARRRGGGGRLARARGGGRPHRRPARWRAIRGVGRQRGPRRGGQGLARSARRAAGTAPHPGGVGDRSADARGDRPGDPRRDRRPATLR